MKTTDRFVLLTCLVFWLIMVGAWTNTIRTDIPADDADPSETPTFIRDTKNGFIERLDVDHYFTASASSTYDATDTGKHRFITFREPNSISSVNADEGVLFTKDVNSVAELHWIDESENEKQLTEGGVLFIEAADLAEVLLDEDDMASDSATDVPSQQSVKAYVDTELNSQDLAADGSTVFNTTLTAANTWQDLDLSSYTGANSAIVWIEVNSSASAGFYIKTKGYGSSTVSYHQSASSGTYPAGTGLISCASNSYYYTTMMTDSSGVVQIAASNNTTTFTIKLIGYLPTP